MNTTDLKTLKTTDSIALVNTLSGERIVATIKKAGAAHLLCSIDTMMGDNFISTDVRIARATGMQVANKPVFAVCDVVADLAGNTYDARHTVASLTVTTADGLTTAPVDVVSRDGHPVLLVTRVNDTVHTGEPCNDLPAFVAGFVAPVAPVVAPVEEPAPVAPVEEPAPVAPVVAPVEEPAPVAPVAPVVAPVEEPAPVATPATLSPSDEALVARVAQVNADMRRQSGDRVPFTAQFFLKTKSLLKVVGNDVSRLEALCAACAARANVILGVAPVAPVEEPAPVAPVVAPVTNTPAEAPSSPASASVEEPAPVAPAAPVEAPAAPVAFDPREPLDKWLALADTLLGNVADANTRLLGAHLVDGIRLLSRGLLVPSLAGKAPKAPRAPKTSKAPKAPKAPKATVALAGDLDADTRRRVYNATLWPACKRMLADGVTSITRDDTEALLARKYTNPSTELVNWSHATMNDYMAARSGGAVAATAPKAAKPAKAPKTDAPKAAKIAVGGKVRLSADAQHAYIGALNDEELHGTFTVVKVSGARLFAKTEVGDEVRLPVADVVAC